MLWFTVYFCEMMMNVDGIQQLVVLVYKRVGIPLDILGRLYPCFLAIKGVVIPLSMAQGKNSQMVR